MCELIKSCRITGDKFAISELEQEICQKCEVPLPTMHPRERMRRLMAFNNYQNLFRGKCDATAESILQIYRPGHRFPVYSSPYWWSDNWNALDYGREYDFKEPFFTQFKQLQDCVPQQALSVNYSSLENCDYINGASYCKNCYLTIHAAHNEDSLYCFTLWRSRDCIDCTVTCDCELCYDCVFVKNCYNLRHSFNCQTCRDSAFLWNSTGCENCFGCVNLHHRKYCFFNEQLTKEQYQDRIARLEFDNYEAVEDLRGKFREFLLSNPQPSVHGCNLENCSGDFINNSRNAYLCFNGAELWDCFNCFAVESSRDCMDYCSWGENCELIYCTTRCGYNSQNVKFCCLVYLDCSDMEYSMTCISCKNCFGCIGLRNMEYCIFNKQYSRDEYQELRGRIIAQMKEDGLYGEFFPYSLSPFPFNDSDAMLYLPLSQRDAEARGAVWAELPTKTASSSNSWNDLPKTSRQMPESVTSETFCCLETGLPYRITSQELEIYKKRLIPLPRKHWKARFAERRKLFNAPELYRRNCAKTGLEVTSSYPPGSSWIVWDIDAFRDEFFS